jgi:hypothetical protein
LAGSPGVLVAERGERDEDRSMADQLGALERTDPFATTSSWRRAWWRRWERWRRRWTFSVWLCRTARRTTPAPTAFPASTASGRTPASRNCFGLTGDRGTGDRLAASG